MKRLITMLAIVLLSTSAFAQPSKSSVTAHAKKRYPGHEVYNVLGEELWDKGSKYYWWSFNLKHKVDLPGYPGVTEVGYSSAYFWPNGSLKQNGYYVPQHYLGMRDPSRSELQVAIDNFDIPAYFGRNDRIIEVKDINLLDGMTYEWYDEKNMRLTGAEMTETRLSSGKTTLTTHGEITIRMERDDYKSPWRIKSLGFVDYQPKFHEETSKTYTAEEYVAIENSTYEFKFAEDIARKEWEGLIEMDIPFESPEQMSLLANKIFSTGSRDEVKAFLFRTTPTGKFWEGSKYRFDYSQSAFIRETMEYIFDKEHNYQNEYCPTSVISGRTKYGYTFANHSLTNETKYKFMKDADRYSLVDLDMYLSVGDATNGKTDARKYPCRGEVYPEKFEMADAFCSVEFPAGMEKKTTKPQRLKQLHYATAFDACNYDVYATWLDPEERTNADRASIAKNTGDNTIEHQDGLLSSETKTFELNGVTGYEIRMTYKIPNAIQESVTRFILLGGVFYQISVMAPELRENEIALLETFQSSLEGSGDSGAVEEVVEFKVGDYVIVEYDWAKSGSPQQRLGLVEEVLKPGMFLVYYYQKGTKQGMPIRFLKPDPKNGKAHKKK